MESFDFVLNLLIRDEIFKYFFAASNVIALLCWLATLINNNFSQIDRLWSLLPMLYSWCFMYTSLRFNQNSERVLLMTSLITLWGVRLTYNYWRKGGYKQGEEDYRWVHVKKMFYYPQVKVLFHLFNIVFIAFIQNWLLLGLTVPIWYVQTSQVEELNLCDWILTGLFLLFFAIEVIADEQQWSFQNKKKQFLIKKENSTKFSLEEIEDFKRGFLTRGLFRYSRHPNFFGELSMWWTIYSFTLNVSNSSLLLNYSIFGSIVLQLIFLQSTPLTERISLSKYPLYSEYQSQVSRIIPFISNLKLKSN